MISAPSRRIGFGGRPMEGLSMLKVDPAFLLDLGTSMRRVREVTSKTPMAYGYFLLSSARNDISEAVEQSIYSHLFRVPTRASANALLNHITVMCDMTYEDEESASRNYTVYDVSTLGDLYVKFETLFISDLQASALYLVSPKGGFDTGALIEFGIALFSRDLGEKVPASVSDIQQAARCVAFELPTAAGFHLHRAHESVLRIYWDCVTGGKPRPEENNMGVYLRELDRLKVGKPAVRSHLRSIKDFHRNPLMHPEQSLDTVDQAIDLMAAIRCSIGYMLQEIPGDEPPMLAKMESA